MPTLAEIYRTNNTAKGTTQSSLPVKEKSDNNLIKGIGYLLEKNVAAFVNSIENSWDYQASAIAKLFGADEWAEKQVENDWFGDWYSHPDEWFKADKGWKVAGDVSSGIGSSGPSVALSFIPYAGPIVSVLHAAMAGAGGALKESYKETGELGGKQYLYGGLSGGVEGVIEYASNKLGIGSVGAIKNIGKSATKSIASRIGIAAAEGFLGEAFEEGVTELVNPYLKQISYDPNAKNATAQEVVYAALVGGLSGAFMGGGGASVDVASSITSGTKAVNGGKTAEIMEFGKFATTFEDTQQTKNEYYDRVATSYKALEASINKTGGEVTTANQRMLLGDLERANVKAVFAPMMYREAANILDDAEGFVARFNSNEYADTDGKPLSITVEALTKGYDPDNPSSIAEAIKSNSTLRSMAAMVLSGKIVSDTSSMTNSMLEGNRIGSKADLAWLSERATPEQIERVSEAMGITDWSNVDEVNSKIDAYKQSDAYKAYKENAGYVAKIKEAKAKKIMPKGFAGLGKDGDAVRYTDGTMDVGIARIGDEYIVYDFNRELQSKRMSQEEVGNFFKEYSKEQYSAEEVKRKEASAKRKAEAEEIDTWARENIEDYATLSAPNKTMIRKVIRQARANGLSESDVKMWADMSAHSGIDVVFDKRLSEIKVKVEQEDGTVKTETRFANAYYDEKGNRIVVNPEARISQEKALFHELDHALRSFFGGGTPAIYKGALDSLDDTTKAELKKQYGSNEAIFNDEANAFYAAEVMGEKGFARSIATTKPKAFEKIMNFFKDAINYKNDGYSKAARKYYKEYKAMYEAFSAVNKGNNALEGAEGGKRYSYSSIESTFFGRNGISVEEFDKYKKTQGYKDYVDKCLNNMRQTRKDFNEATARKEIEDSIAGIVRVAKAAKKAGYDIIDVAEKDREARDSKNRLLFSSLEPNSDYFTSSDISTICDKQKNFTEIYEEIIRQEKALGVPPEKSFFKDVNNYFAIHKIMADKGMTTPCEQCYFNTMRKNLEPMAMSFLKLVKEENIDNKSNDALYDKKGRQKANNAKLREAVREAFNTKNYDISLAEMDAEMLTTRDGLARLKLQAPEIFEAFNSFYGQSKPKMPREATPFRFGELTALLTDSNGKISESLVKKIESTGGFRLQSYSDFQIANYVDVLQVIFEAGTLGLSGHAYTKVPAFLEATEGTNLKRNISVFMYKGETGWRIDKGDSFPGTLEDIIALVKADKTGNTSIIDVVQNADNAAWLMANDDIGYGIPFHKSGAKMGVVREKVVKEDGREIKGYKDIKDHTRQQTEVWAKTTDDHKAFTKVKKGINIYEFWDFDNKKGLSKNKLIEKNLKAYINACKEAGYLPKFREYLINNEKVLNDTLTYAKRLGFADTKATIDDISFTYGGYRIPYGYYKFLGDFGMFKPNGESSPHKVLSLKDYDFAKAEKFFENAEQVKRNEILQQFENGEVREEYRKSDLTTSQLQDIIDAKRKEIAGDIVSKRYATLPEGARASVDLDYAGYDETLTVQDVNVLRPFPKKQSINDFSSDQIKKSRKWAYKFYKELGEKSPFFRASFGEWRAYQRKTFVRIVGENNNAIFKSGKAKNSDMNDVVISWGRDIKGETINHLVREKASESALNNIGEIIENAIYFETIVSHPDSNAKMSNTAFMHSLYSLYRTNDGKVQLLKIYVEEAMSDNESVVFKRGYQLKDIIKVAELPNSVLSKEGGLTDGKSTTRYSVADLYEFVKTYDNKFTPAPEISPKAAKLLLNRDGTPKIYYHGTKVDFDVFDKAKLFDKFGFYFTEDIREAREYGTPHGYYLTIKNPIDIYSDEYYNKYYRIKDPEQRVKALQADGYDGVSSYSHGVQWLIAFEPTQMKSATDNIGVFDSTSDNRKYSLDLGIETKVLTEMPDKYKAKGKEKISNAWTSLQISLTNEQAGIEKIGKKIGIKDIEARVQAARASRNMAEMMLGNEQYRIGASKKEDIVYQGEGLGKIFSYIPEEDTEAFYEYLLLWHNTSRMTLAEKSQAQMDSAQKDFDAKAAELVKANKALNKLINQKEGVEPRSAEARELNKKIAEARAKTIKARKAANEAKKILDGIVLEDNKPIMQKADGEFVTAEESKKIIAEVEKERPNFKEVAEKVWAYNRNLNQYRVDTGLISQEQFDYLNEKYPYYVPTYRDGGAKGIVPISGSHDIAVKQTVKTAKGSGKDVLPIKTIMARQTMETIRAGQLNRLTKSLYDASGDGEYISVVSRKKNDNLEVNPTETRPKDNQITFFDNGEQITLAVTKEIFQGFEGFRGTALSDTDAFKVMNKINKGFKSLVTSYSPAFMIRNPIRDIQDAGIYTKYGKTFAKNYARVGELIKNNSMEWQIYRAMGGLSSSIFDMDKGTKASQNKWGLTKEEGNILKKGLGAIENANVFLEQLPRFAEFLSAIEAGKSYEQAILDSADVTTNFGRTGKITKVLNSTIIPFLNPSIQGFSKMIRSVTSIKTSREAGALFMKAAILGVAPMVLNMLMYGDDEDYEDLRENDKENNFLIKIGNTFIKIPRGRVASALGGLVNRTAKTVKGEDADWKGYIENVSQQVTPVDSMSRTIFSPILRDLPTNTTWYGTEIEGRQFENVAPKDRYDESTSEIAKLLGKVFNYSPKKIHYLLDQYSGVIGDFILPLSSKKAEKDFFSGNFTIDPATSNKLSSDFYKLYDEAQYAKSAGDDIAKYQVRYLNSVKSAVSELYKEKSAIQNSDLKAVDKLQQTRTVQVLINEAFKTAKQDYELYTKAFEATSQIEDEDMRYVESIRLTQGAEKAFEVYDKKVAAKYSLIAKSGIDYNELYYYYFSQKDLENDKDKQGNVIAGSKKQKVLKLVNELKVNKNQKLLLLAASGYSVGDRTTKIKLARYITSLKASKEEKADLAEMCGFKVKNGTILISSIK